MSTILQSNSNIPLCEPSTDNSKSMQKAEKQRQKKDKQAGEHSNKKQQKQQKQKVALKDERPFYQTLGEELLAVTVPGGVIKSLPSPALGGLLLSPIPSYPVSPLMLTPESEVQTPFFKSYDTLPHSRSTISLHLGRRSEESTLSGSTVVTHDDYQHSEAESCLKGTIYKLNDLAVMDHTESLIMRYGRVAHMGVRDPSYSFWMNHTRTAVIHFKVLNKVAVLGGDPLCHPDRLALSMREFEAYCKQVGWKTAVMGASGAMAAVAKARRWTTMQFGTETVLNPQTNEVLLGKSGKRIATQCKQLLDPTRGGVSVHTYSPSLGRDAPLEVELCNIYDNWRNDRNTSRDSQAFITVFEMFAMGSLMTFLYTKDKSGRVNGFAALRQLGANDGYHIDPFIQTADAPRGISDLLIFSSLALLRAAGVTYLSLGFEPLASVGEISGLPLALHSTTRKVYQHVFGKIPVGGKEVFHARWKPDIDQEQSVYLVFVGRISSPRFMLAMTHYAHISLRSILKQDWESLKKSPRRGSTRENDVGVRVVGEWERAKTVVSGSNDSSSSSSSSRNSSIEKLSTSSTSSMTTTNQEMSQDKANITGCCNDAAGRNRASKPQDSMTKIADDKLAVTTITTKTKFKTETETETKTEIEIEIEIENGTTTTSTSKPKTYDRHASIPTIIVAEY